MKIYLWEKVKGKIKRADEKFQGGNLSLCSFLMLWGRFMNNYLSHYCVTSLIIQNFKWQANISSKQAYPPLPFLSFFFAFSFFLSLIFSLNIIVYLEVRHLKTHFWHCCCHLIRCIYYLFQLIIETKVIL